MEVHPGGKISLSDCYKIVSQKVKSDEYQIVEIREKSFAEKQGFLGEHSLLIIDVLRSNEDRRRLSFFVKSPPQEYSQRKFLYEMNGLFKEKRFYDTYCSLLKTLSINILDEAVPAYYLTTGEDIILEDLSALGYGGLSSRQPLTFDLVKAALIALAKLHASGLILEETKSFRLRDQFVEELQESFFLGTDSTKRAANSAKLGLETLVDLTHTDDMAIDKETFKAKICKVMGELETIVKPHSRFRNTICHADPWTKNFMFKSDNRGAKQCVIVDFQTYRYGPPAQDVMHFLHLVTDISTKQKPMEELLLFYYDQLNYNMEKYGFRDIVTKDEFLESCCYYEEYSIILTLMHYQVVILRDDIAKELFSQPDKTMYVLFDEGRKNHILTTCQRDSHFKKLMCDKLDILRDFYVNRDLK